MSYNKIVNKLLEKQNEKNKKEEILDYTKDIEEYMKKVLPEENN